MPDCIENFGMMTEKIDFDELIIDIETKTFDLQVCLAAYVTRMLRICNWTADLDVLFPFCKNESCEMCQAERIVYDEESEVIFLIIAGRENDLTWDDLDLGSQDMIVNYLHMKYTSEQIYNNLSSHEDAH